MFFFIFQSENLENTVIIPDIKLHSNPSAFNIYCNVRHCVLEWQKKETSLAAASKNSVQSGESDSDEEEESKEPPIKLPKVCTEFDLDPLHTSVLVIIHIHTFLRSLTFSKIVFLKITWLMDKNRIEVVQESSVGLVN